MSKKGIKKEAWRIRAQPHWTKDCLMILVIQEYSKGDNSI